MDKLFIDTDVVLDFLTGREPFAMDAARLFLLSERKKVHICTSGLVFSNAYYILRKLASHSKVIDKLKQLTRFLDVINLSKAAVMSALDSHFSDFEGALQYQAVIQEQVKTIITRNIKDYKHSELAVMTAEQYLKAVG